MTWEPVAVYDAICQMLDSDENSRTAQKVKAYIGQAWNEAPNRPFAEWLTWCEHLVTTNYHLSLFDLAPQDYRGWFESGATPEGAIRTTIRLNGEVR